MLFRSAMQNLRLPPAAPPPAREPVRVLPAPAPKHPGAVRAAVAAAALILILLGILNGSARDVLIKAIHLCSECIGLG